MSLVKARRCFLNIDMEVVWVYYTVLTRTALIVYFYKLWCAKRERNN